MNLNPLAIKAEITRELAPSSPVSEPAVKKFLRLLFGGGAYRASVQAPGSVTYKRDWWKWFSGKGGGEFEHLEFRIEFEQGRVRLKARAGVFFQSVNAAAFVGVLGWVFLDLPCAPRGLGGDWWAFPVAAIAFMAGAAWLYSHRGRARELEQRLYLCLDCLTLLEERV